MAKNKFTPEAPCKFPYLTQPKTKIKQGDDFKDIPPVYTTALVFDQNDPFVATVEKAAEKAFEEAKSKLKPAEAKKAVLHTPIRDEEDKDGEPTGNVLITFKTAAERKNKKTKEVEKVELYVADAKGKRVTKVPNIGSGSKLCLAFNPSGRYMAPSVKAAPGIFYYTLYLNGVQLIELVEFGNPGFAAREGGYSADDSEVDEDPFGATVDDTPGADDDY